MGTCFGFLYISDSSPKWLDNASYHPNLYTCSVENSHRQWFWGRRTEHFWRPNMYQPWSKGFCWSCHSWLATINGCYQPLDHRVATTQWLWQRRAGALQPRATNPAVIPWLRPQLARHQGGVGALQGSWCSASCCKAVESECLPLQRPRFVFCCLVYR